MLQVTNFGTQRVHTEELHGYFSQVNTLTQLLKPAEGSETPLYQSAMRTFQGAYAVFDETLKASASVEASKRVIACDERRDDAWTGGYTYLKGMCWHPTAEVAALAQKLLDIYNKYGNPTALARNKETGILIDLIQDLEAVPSDERTTLHFDVWLTDLKAKQSEFDEAMEQRTEQKSRRMVGVIQTARKDVEAAYTEFIDIINALIRIEGSATYADFVAKMNVLIAEQKTELRRRDTLNQKKKENTDEEPPKEEEPPTGEGEGEGGTGGDDGWTQIK